MITLLLVAAALAWLLWPRGASVPKPADLFAVVPAAAPVAAPAVLPPSPPDGRAAIDSLLAVRDRLAAAGPMDEGSAKAIDTLWLDLLHTGGKR